jgi:hypothetical protein
MPNRIAGTLQFEPGSVTRFPLQPGDPRAEFVRTVPVESYDQVIDFGFVRGWTFTDRELDRLAERSRADEDLEQRSAYLFERNEGDLSASMQDTVYAMPYRIDKNLAVKAIAKLFGDVVLELAPTEFVVPAGATVVLGSGLQRITADRVVIEGTLNVLGHLVIEANELRGVS